MPDEKPATKPEAPAPKEEKKMPAFAAAAPRPKKGDIVTYWAAPSAAPLHAVVLEEVGPDGAASLKVCMPGGRRGGGGVARTTAQFSAEAKPGCWGASAP
jgi:hypothetical protein